MLSVFLGNYDMILYGFYLFILSLTIFKVTKSVFEAQMLQQRPFVENFDLDI